MREVQIVSTGVYLPDRVLSNFDLEKTVDTSDKWIVERTGIRERRIAAEEEATSDLATKASLHALEGSGIAPEDLDLIVLATITPDMLLPATACLVQRSLGATKAAAFDVSAACSGFVYALSIAANAIRLGTAEHALVIGAETMSRMVNWKDRNTCVLFGDGAGAAVLGPSDEPSLLFETLGSDGNLADLIQTRAGGSRCPASLETVRNGHHFVEVRGREVFRQAVKVMEQCTLGAIERLGVSVEDIDLLIPHQANIRIMEASAKRTGFPLERMFVNVNRYGNTSGATNPIALHEALMEGRIKPGDLVIMVSFGAGFTWATAAIRWPDNKGAKS